MKERFRGIKKIIGIFLIAAVVSICLGSPALTYEAEASVFSEDDLAYFAEANDALQDILAEREIMALVYLADEYAVRTAPGEEGAAVVYVPSGQLVRIQEVKITENLEAWAKVNCMVLGQEYTGYVNRQNLACSDELFLAWEAEYGMNPAMYQTMMMTENISDTPVYADIEQFPESYREALLELKKLHPLWTFVKMDTGLEWDKVVAEELKKDRSLIHGSNVTAMKEGLYGQNWYYASEEALEYYLDPRNGLTENRIFQFEQLTYNASYHTEDAVQLFLDQTFMKGKVPMMDNMTFAQAFTAIGKEEGIQVSPFHLASRVYQEQGDGTSPLISGNYNEEYKGYYNYYNIGATGKTNKEVIESGLAYAKARDWDCPYYSLHFGAEIIAAGYIKIGQDTLYLQKFDVDNSDGELYWHQYMQNIGAPFSEAASIKKLYQSAGALDNTFVFKIPVYKNMPGEICEKPAKSNRVVLSMPFESEDMQIYLDGKAVTAVKRNGYLVAEAPNDQAGSAVMYQYNASGVPIGMTVWTTDYDGSGYVAKEVPELKDVLSYHGFSVRITGRSGLRYKSGISQETKNKLTGSGVEGYTVKEYGTLLLPSNLLGESQLTLDTEKAARGLSYGKDEKGQIVDKVLEKVSGRDRFASVLVGLPVSQYKTEFAFRAYMVLTKNGKDIVIYGPQKEKSIYGLAEQILNADAYPQGSSPEVFLRKIVSDADAYEAGANAVSGNDVAE